MEIIKLEDGWKILDTGKFIDFGQISLDIYNYEIPILDEISFHLKKIFPILQEKHFDIVSRGYERCKYEDDIFKKDNKIVALISSEINLSQDKEFHYNYSYSSDKQSPKDRYAYPLTEEWIKEQFESCYGDEYLIKSFSLYSIIEKRGFLLKSLFSTKFKRDFNNTDEYITFVTEIIKSHFNNTNAERFRLETIPRWYKTKVYRAYIVNNIYDLYFDDFAEIINSRYSAKKCPLCEKMFIQKDKRKNFCPICSTDKNSQKKYNEQKRQKNPRYLHKRINDILKNRNDLEEADIFYKESIYYQNILDNKIQNINPEYTEQIKTSSDYKKWLEKKYNQYLKRPRKNLPAK